MFKQRTTIWSVLAIVGLAQPAGYAQATAVATDLQVSEVWVREASTTQGSTGGYLIVRNMGAGPTRLVGVRTDAAKRAELHTMVTTDQVAAPGTDRGAMPGMGGGAMMTMQRVEAIAVPAHASVALKPGGYHVMLFDVTTPLRVGDTISLTLAFDGGVTKTVAARVQSRAATGFQP